MWTIRSSFAAARVRRVGLSLRRPFECQSSLQSTACMFVSSDTAEDESITDDKRSNQKNISSSCKEHIRLNRVVGSWRGERLTTFRSYSSQHKNTFSSLEYPLATEEPEVSRTTAQEAAAAASNSSLSSSSKHPPLQRRLAKGTLSPEHEDPFDDLGTLSPQQAEDVRKAQSQHLPTQLSPGSNLTISTRIPEHIPPNVPSSELETPTTILTTLENGIRVVSQETYGQVSTVGVVSAVGSRLERASRGETGLCNLLEVLAFGSTHHPDYPSAHHVTTILQDWGGTRFCTSGREQSLHCIDILRPNVDKALHLLGQTLLQAQFEPHEVEDASRALEFQVMDMPPELLLGEALQVAAYGSDQELGQPHYFCAKPTSSGAAPGNMPRGDSFSQETVQTFWKEHFLQNPTGLVIAGAGVQHDYLVELAEKEFGHLQQHEPAAESEALTTRPSVYRGGEHRVHHNNDPMDGFVRVSLALPVGGWHSDDLVATCVLQTLLGGGSSFSAGGPGKGMYSRLYRKVLNRYSWAESSEAFTAFYNETGLWGIAGSTVPGKARDMVQVLAEHMARLAVELVADEELDRARNMLKNNVLTQLESRLVLFEDMGRQVLTYGHRENMHTTCEKIDAVTAQDLRDLAARAIQSPPTVASVGPQLKHVPLQEEVASWFR